MSLNDKEVPKAFDLPHPLPALYTWEPQDEGLRASMFMFGHRWLFSEGDYLFFMRKGGDPNKRSVYRIVEIRYGHNENHQWSASLEYVEGIPAEYVHIPYRGLLGE